MQRGCRSRGSSLELAQNRGQGEADVPHEQGMVTSCHHKPWAQGRSRVRGTGTRQGHPGDTRGCRKVPQARQ